MRSGCWASSFSLGDMCLEILWKYKVLRSAFPAPPPKVSSPSPPPISFKSANSHRHEPPQVSILVTVVVFWCLKAFILVTVVTFGSSRFRRASKVPKGSGWSSSRSSELSPLLAPYVFVGLQIYQQINSHRYKASIEP